MTTNPTQKNSKAKYEQSLRKCREHVERIRQYLAACEASLAQDAECEIDWADLGGIARLRQNLELASEDARSLASARPI